MEGAAPVWQPHPHLLGLPPEHLCDLIYRQDNIIAGMQAEQAMLRQHVDFLSGQLQAESARRAEEASAKDATIEQL
jgi:hypothetical protein